MKAFTRKELDWVREHIPVDRILEAERRNCGNIPITLLWIPEERKQSRKPTPTDPQSHPLAL